jgi:FkbM family methyltransferase
LGQQPDADDIDAAWPLRRARALYQKDCVPEWFYKAALKAMPAGWYPVPQTYVLRGEIEGRAFDLQLRTDDTIGREAWLYGYYDRLVLEFLRAFVQRLNTEGTGQSAFYDIGANIGNHTVFLVDLFEHVYCFEPNPKALEILKTNVRELTQVKIFPVGLSNEDAQLDFMTGSATNLGNAHIVTPEETYEPMARISVRNGDRLIDDEKLVPPTIMKIDVEGHEPEVIAGLEATIKRHKPVIVMEILARALDKISPIAEQLNACGYRVFKMSGLGRVQQSMRFRNELVLSPFDFDGPCENAIAIAPAHWKLARELVERNSGGWAE